MGTVYGLHDPDTDERRYVGVTIRTLQHRLRQHLVCRRKKSGPFTHREAWVRSLKSDPVIKAIETDVPETDLYEREIEVIAECLARGERLTNLTPGGDHCAREGWEHTLDAREAISIAARERTTHAEDCNCFACSPKSGEDHPRFGTHHTEETKRTIGEKVSKANRGKSKSPEHVARVWAARRENGTDGHTDETRAKISRTKRERASVTVPCPECGRECKGEAGMRIHRKKAHRRV